MADPINLTEAIDQNNLARVQFLMLQDPALHRAPVGYGNDGPLTWVAECRVPPEAPDETRLSMAQWMIQNGSDIHRGGDAPLMRAALDGKRIPMMELLVSHGADVNAAWHGSYPVLFAPCETLDPDSLQWLLEHGADPNCGSEQLWKSRGVPHPGTALDYLLATYVREPAAMSQCIELLLKAGAQSKHASPAMLAIIRHQLDELMKLLDQDPSLLFQRFPSWDFGTTAGRMLTLQGATLLHLAAEYGNLKAAALLLDRGADVNATAGVNQAGVGGQTAVFHAATQVADRGLAIVQLLTGRGADLKLRARIPGHYEKPGEMVECTPLEYALLFPGDHGPVSRFLLESAY